MRRLKFPFSVYKLRKLYFHFLSNWMGYDRGDSFLFDFEPNGIPSGSKSKGIFENNFCRNFSFFLLFFYCLSISQLYLIDFEPNGIPFGSKSKRKLSPLSYPIKSERKYSFLSVNCRRIFDVCCLVYLKRKHIILRLFRPEGKFINKLIHCKLIYNIYSL